ncbi:piggyBac transposable element-derived protein 4-like [Rhinichthys klamathensis goyatoka]|uniref:piggyBac transposable element-derived protein 4-like n=1 Tax=Rhinichthys klamathensis goyatoka TaxID=3034132 RepID=UPI0024B5CF43|nr:piggyBac transposable element-derived protein 4-like [Rhinichthys klamathensis goyatoka]XP_056123858.1 piggyBac transposable element-derived protein 4-like [Rhinichthys klamathensis goyatoka]XP_056123860.1 piggyBac transposable element-derived protein 4-like [Rhinichthys klamathensis goyatoka]
MTRYTGAEALQLVLDSDEEFTFSSEEERDSDDERLYFEERLDPAMDTISDDYKDDGDHQTPVAKRAKTNIQTSNKQSTLSWKTETDIDLVPQTLRFLPAQEPGPQLRPADTHTPQSLFKVFFSENAVSNLCHNTNAQAAGAIEKGRKFKWTDVSISEMYRYIGLVFYMAMVKMSSIKDYWRQDSLFSLPFPATIMTRERYRTISWNVHMSHPDADKENDRKRGTPEHDRLFRVKPLMDTIRHACKAIYHPRRNLAVDERMVACKAHTGMTQYMKAKPTRWVFKLFVLADSSNGYTLDFSVYTGKNNFPTGHGLSYDAVTSLLDCKVLGSGYHVYMDNFYTSPKLLKDLFAMKFGACGTYRDNRKDCPRDTTNSLSKKSARGSIRWIRDGPLVFVKWMDTREVSVCSTIQSAYTGETVQRRVKTQDTWRTMTFPCPAPVTAYNKHMGGVDLSDQLLQYYTAQHKTMKWYRKIFLHFLDIAATNAFLIHKELCGNMTHKQFMEQLIAELCGVSQKVAPKQTSSDHVPVPGAELSSDATNICTVGRKICVLCKGQLGCLT